MLRVERNTEGWFSIVMELSLIGLGLFLPLVYGVATERTECTAENVDVSANTCTLDSTLLKFSL